MKIIIMIFLCILSLKTELLCQHDKNDNLTVSDLIITVISSRDIDVGSFYPGSKEALINKELIFRVQGEAGSDVSWEISKINESQISLSLLIFLSEDGLTWTQSSSALGKVKLNKDGYYFIKTEAKEIEIPPGAKEGTTEITITLSVDYDFF